MGRRFGMETDITGTRLGKIENKLIYRANHEVHIDRSRDLVLS